jgi:hypothetical protein
LSRRRDGRIVRSRINSRNRVFQSPLSTAANVPTSITITLNCRRLPRQLRSGSPSITQYQTVTTPSLPSAECEILTNRPAGSSVANAAASSNNPSQVANVPRNIRYASLFPFAAALPPGSGGADDSAPSLGDEHFQHESNSFLNCSPHCLHVHILQANR